MKHKTLRMTLAALAIVGLFCLVGCDPPPAVCLDTAEECRPYCKPFESASWISSTDESECGDGLVCPAGDACCECFVEVEDNVEM